MMITSDSIEVLEREMPTSDSISRILKENMSLMKKRFGVRTIALFGSFVREEAGENSDIDILVEFEHATFDRYMDLKFFLEDLFGRNVDLVLSDSIKPRARTTILREARYV